MTRLTGPAFWRWMGLRRVSCGWVARFEGRYYDGGRRMPGYLVPDVLDMLVTQGLLSVADPDEDGWQRVALTEAGLAEYRALCRRQQRAQLEAPAPEFGTVRCLATPADRRSSPPLAPSRRSAGPLPGRGTP